MKILVAEDERKVLDFVRSALESAGMVVDTVSSVSDLIPTLERSPYDVAVLDRLLGKDDVIDSMGEIRSVAPNTKVLILSALTEVEEKVRGLSEGADDYLGKPFHVEELVARLRTLGRRATPSNKKKDTLLLYGDLSVNLETQRVDRGGRKIDLTGKEFRILSLLLRQPGHVFSRASLLDLVWDLNHDPESNVVEVTIANLRAKIDKGFAPLIQSRRGMGYWLGHEKD